MNEDKNIIGVYQKLLDSAMLINEQLRLQNAHLDIQLKEVKDLFGHEDLILQQTVYRIVEEIRDELHCHFIDNNITINMLGKDLDTFLDKLLMRYHTYADR